MCPLVVEGGERESPGKMIPVTLIFQELSLLYLSDDFSAYLLMEFELSSDGLAECVCRFARLVALRIA